jgi:hypothetical protein
MSGSGAYYLYLRHPDVFGKASCYDSPLGWTWWPNDSHVKPPPYTFYPEMINQSAAMLKAGGTNLVVLGYKCYQGEVEGWHKRLLSLGIPHEYDNRLRDEHGFSTNWLPENVELLMK